MAGTKCLLVVGRFNILRCLFSKSFKWMYSYLISQRARSRNARVQRVATTVLRIDSCDNGLNMFGWCRECDNNIQIIDQKLQYNEELKHWHVTPIGMYFTLHKKTSRILSYLKTNLFRRHTHQLILYTIQILQTNYIHTYNRASQRVVRRLKYLKSIELIVY